ncbi:ribosyldihydronicotinamide dehydrogenase [quinone] isoform X1 [Sceloporus undulatus]|uniref:ribosyldihydronicotinamide dehydrogenase [quinone] isoform X1 n=1 Tax=Sceloporus undulatus TaxID=8520 RepID=UPI001C4CD6FF|nr:ribosyldihydronicotinamide dehydrogenase [quinone] isoform X1 [Sceloporus undulatus]XP_042320784.1 ribosyldihydronicotinamide dehydrogenase [quinone] isoform X1 [Sceloporus undulatus]XP_042320785.1 ribosyldihydronicotinamide dehydrogenase [quinone] isoform X1 [Sceloporus undulatus]XP_042320786.1 ribosyldihydronicotinamide dehydrogenase [quinone] isoform X1 [Sceloporus undulatus]XP_042320787.1 ribosyldihydronicotinamide dehydrogenase [quinone] isoform X1 [Sceloporus undulatus]
MAGKKVLIVYAHQEPKSLNGSLKAIAVEELSKQGSDVTVSDLYDMQFEPRTTRTDIVGDLYNPEQFNYGVEAWEACKNGCLSEDLIEEQRKVKEADLLIFQFPLYWFSMPAIMKGWMDRVFIQGFAHDFPKCFDSGLLRIKKPCFHLPLEEIKECIQKKDSVVIFVGFCGPCSMGYCISVASVSWLLRYALHQNMWPWRRESKCCHLGQSG